MYLINAFLMSLSDAHINFAYLFESLFFSCLCPHSRYIFFASSGSWWSLSFMLWIILTQKHGWNWYDRSIISTSSSDNLMGFFFHWTIVLIFSFINNKLKRKEFDNNFSCFLDDHIQVLVYVENGFLGHLNDAQQYSCLIEIKRTSAPFSGWMYFTWR